jgi:glycosyltransferase involved in cell wall biosynthesis
MESITVFLEHRFCRAGGAVWGAMDGYRFWQRYLDVFDKVKVVARVCQAAIPPSGWQRADGERVTFLDIPYYVGPWQYLRRMLVVRRAVSKALQSNDAVILRVPSQLAAIAYSILIRSNRPYGVEVIADPSAVFRGGSRLCFASIFRLKFVHQLKKQCKNAAVASYVTEKALQDAYRSSPSAFVTHYSSVDLPESLFVREPRRVRVSPRMPLVLTAGSLESFVKGTDVLIEAAAICRRKGMNVRVLIAGEGRCRTVMEQNLGALDRKDTEFLGHLARREILERMEEADLFVLSSRSEGLPAALIEAMAKGVPCISTHVGGIPELLPLDDLVLPGDAPALASKILEVLSSPARMESMSEQNLLKAREYEEAVLRPRRQECFIALKKVTEKYWSM